MFNRNFVLISFLIKKLYELEFCVNFLLKKFIKLDAPGLTLSDDRN